MKWLLPHRLPLGLWTAVWFLFFAPLLAGWARLPHSDFSGQFYAYAQHQARELWSGRLPLWSPGSFGGVPFVADPQAAVFYPPRWLTILLGGPDLPYFALEIEGLLHIWLLGAGLYFLLVDLLSDPNAPALTAPARWSALLSVFVFSLGGYITAYPLLQLAILETWTWLPWALLLLRRAIQPDQGSRRTLVGSALLMGLAITAGHPQTALHSGYLWGGYAFFLAWRAGWGWRPGLRLGGLLLLVALGCSAVAWLPIIRYWPTTVRLEAGYDFVSGGQIATNYLQGFIPTSLTQWSPEYIGLPAFFLALVAWLSRRQLGRLQAEVNFWAGASALALWLSLGDKGLLFALWYRIAPGFQLFRQQERLVGAAVLAAAVLAAIGLYTLLSRAAPRPVLGRALAWSAGGLAAAALFLTVAAHLAAPGWGWRAAIALVVLAAAVAISWRLAAGRPSPFLVLTLLLLVAADLWWAARPGLNLEPRPPDPFWETPAWLETVAQSDGRFDPGFFFFANIGEAVGLESVRGISPLKPAALANLERLPLSKSWPLLAVSHGLFSGDPPADLEVTVVGPAVHSVIPGETNPEALLVAANWNVERAAMRYRVAVPESGEPLFDLMVSDRFDPRHQVALPAEVAALYTVESPSSAPVIEPLATGRRAWQVTTATAGYLTLAEWHLPGQRLTVNGQKVEPLPANLGLIAVFLPAGTHTVTLYFRPPAVLWGALISLLTLATAALFVRRPTSLALLSPPVSHPWSLVSGLSSLVSNARSGNLRPAGRSVVCSLQSLISRLSSLVSRLSHTRWLPIAILAVALLLRFSALDAQELRGDEAFSYLFADKPLAAIVPDLIAAADPHPPLHYLLLGGWIRLSGRSELAMRTLSAAVSLLTLPFIYLIGRRLWGRPVGLLALTLAAFSPGLVWLAQDMRSQYLLAAFFPTMATWILLRQRLGRARIGGWAAYALLAALAMASHYYAVFALLSHGLYLAVTPARRRQLLPWLLSGLGAALLYAPWLWVIVVYQVGANLSDPGTPRLTHYLADILTELSFGQTFGASWIRWPVLGLLLVAIAGWRGRLDPLKSRLNGELLLGGWLLLAAAGIFLLLFRRALFNPYYIATAAPAWLLLTAAGIRQLWRRATWGRWLALVVTASWGVGMMVSLGNYYLNPAFSKSWGYRETTAFLAEQARPGDLFIAHFPDPNFDYYFRDIPMPRTIAPPRPGTSPAATEAYLAGLAADYERLWFIPAHRSGWDPDDVAFNWLTFHTLPERAARFNRLELLAFRPADDLDQVLRPIDRPLGDLVLRGIYATAGGRPLDLEAPLAAGAGETVQVTLYWEAAAAPHQSVTLFVHLLAPDGRLLAQHDGLPVSGTRPTNLWAAGETVLDVHDVIMPDGGVPPGSMLVIGGYDSLTIERLRFSDGADALVVGVFE